MRLRKKSKLSSVKIDPELAGNMSGKRGQVVEVKAKRGECGGIPKTTKLHSTLDFTIITVFQNC